MHRIAARLGARLTAVGSLALACLLLTAHVGTNQVVFEGQAGGYPVRVFIDPPGVVPAQVPIMVRVLDGTPARVTVRAAQWNVGTRGAPPAEDAALVPGEPGLWAHDLWIMTGSSYAVYVAVEGPAGNGSVLVPMQTSATRMLGMKTGMGLMLATLGTLLVDGMLTIIGAAVREGTLTPGVQADAVRRRGGRVAMAAGAALLALSVVGGAKWWDAEEREYKRRMLKPLAMESEVHANGGQRVLTIAITDSLWRTNRLPTLLPDHGKLMHLVLARTDSPEVVLAHLHPLRVQADSFVTPVPPLPAGRYLLFGDMLFQSGATRTLVDTVDVPASSPAVATGGVHPDADDAWRAMQPVAFGTAASLAGGGTLSLTTDATPSIKRDLRLQVTVVDANGRPTALEPYMGMMGHAFVLRTDGSFFMHLHPMGTASMTAQAQLARRERGDTATLDSAALAAALAAAEHGAMDHGAHGSSTVGFPFAFPASGEYLVFVQVRRAGLVETAAFRVEVPASR
jgi:hypothetical protein